VNVQTAPALSEQEIRPAELMDRARIAILTDVGRMLTRVSEFVRVRCPACDADKPRFRYEKNSLRYEECQGCETMYVNPRPPAEVLAWFYQGSPNYAYWNEFIFPASEAARRQKIFVPRVDRVLDICAKYGVSTKALIEVGAGFGTFCSEVQSRGVFERVVAVEPTPDLAETCRKRGLEVIESPVEQIKLGEDELFDVAANFEVIEHLFDPASFVSHMGRLLRPGGILVIACPNGKGFDVETLGPLSNTVDHEHLNYFNPASLAALVERNGFETLESFTPGKLDAELVRTQILSGAYDVSDQPFLKTLLLDEWDRLGQPFQDFLVENNLSSNMWIVARKKLA
jgi:2-polyprenyl-3-methyl-5-hydroxy-6-metoxy-1,4-benzoquinol methylase/ribosomal protein S27E